MQCYRILVLLQKNNIPTLVNSTTVHVVSKVLGFGT